MPLLIFFLERYLKIYWALRRMIKKFEQMNFLKNLLGIQLLILRGEWSWSGLCDNSHLWWFEMVKINESQKSDSPLLSRHIRWSAYTLLHPKTTKYKKPCDSLLTVRNKNFHLSWAVKHRKQGKDVELV